jgi:molybdopterin-containing oxidoreductase family iron-sulfur binding subunit
MDRRKFLKLLAAAGVGSVAAFEGIDRFGATEAAEIKEHTDSLQGKHWGMVIDVSKFQSEEDFQRIAEVCHVYHNVPQIDDPKKEIKWIWNDDFEHTFAELESHYLSEKIKQQHFPVLCNQCEEPACVRVCPTKATFKREAGIVVMDYHRCIGCRFCMAACPYGARSFNFFDPRPYIEEINPEVPTRTKGVVEKCNFCVERLEKGLRPLCEEASQGGIIFGDLNDPKSEIRKVLGQNFSIRRKVELGTGPSIYYIFGGGGQSA